MMGKWGSRALCTAAALLLGALCTGALAAAERAEEGLCLPVVMYHHMSPEEKLWGKYVVSPEEFEEDLRYLRSAGYESVTVAQLLDWQVGRGALPEKPCMLTFDDGYESTGAYAAPLLEKYGFTGVVAVIGSVAELYTQQPDHDLRYAHLDWEALKALEASGVLEIQYHSWDMHTLSPRRGCGREKGEGEQAYRAALTEDARRFLETCRTRELPLAPSLAYPYGIYSPLTREVMEQLGFRAAFTCTERVNQLRGEPGELMELGRFNRPHGVSAQAFFGKMGVE